VLAIVEGRYTAAFRLGIAAGITDILDGFFARRMQEVSRTGAYLDPIADKLLLSASFIALGAVGAVPWWMVALVFGRDLFIVAMAAYGYFYTPVREFPPSVWGKLSTFVQIIAALAVVNERSGSSIPAWPFLWAMVAATAWSGVHYGWIGWHALQRVRAQVSVRSTLPEP